MKYRTVVVLVGLTGVVGAAAFATLRPRATRLAITSRAGDDTMVINQIRPTRLHSLLLDQYGRRMRADTAVRYRWITGDSVQLSANGDLRCTQRREAVVRATFGRLMQEFILRCRPVASIEAPSWLDLVVGDSARD